MGLHLRLGLWLIFLLLLKQFSAHVGRRHNLSGRELVPLLLDLGSILLESHASAVEIGRSVLSWGLGGRLVDAGLHNGVLAKQVLELSWLLGLRLTQVLIYQHLLLLQLFHRWKLLLLRNRHLHAPSNVLCLHRVSKLRPCGRSRLRLGSASLLLLFDRFLQLTEVLDLLLDLLSHAYFSS